MTSTNTPRRPTKTTNGKGKTGTKRPPARPITEEERARVRALHAKGMSRNQIAREVGRSQAAVTKIVRAAGGGFDQAATVEATTARLERMRVARVDVAERMLADLPLLRERAWSPYTYYEGSKDGPVEVTLPLPPLREVRDVYGAMAMAVKGHHELVVSAEVKTTDNRRSVLADLITSLGAAVEADRRGEPVPFAEHAPEEPTT